MSLNDKNSDFFSEAGKNSFKLNKLISQFSKTKKINKHNYFFNYLDNLEKLKKIDNDIDIFDINYKEKNNSNKKKNKQLEKEITKIKQKRNKTKDERTPSCTKYNPNYSIRQKKSLSGPEWKKITGRKSNIKKDNFPFYINQDNTIINNLSGKSFIDMRKQISREYFYKNKNSLHNNKNNFNVRSKSSNNLLRNKPDLLIKKCLTNKSNKLIISNFHSLKNNNDKINYSNNNSQSNNNYSSEESSKDSYDNYKIYYMQQFKKKNKNEFKNLKKNNLLDKKKIKAPDFNQFISREHYEKINNKKEVIPFNLPNYKSVRERPIMMVVYNQKKYIKKNRCKSALLKRVDNLMYFDPNKILNKINNYKTIHAPNFKLMTSRPNNNDPLPAYMKKIFNRSSCLNFTELSLKMNNYSNSNFAENKNGFFPKKSYNKIINMNLLKSKKFFNNFYGKNMNQRFVKKNLLIENSMKFYKKNFNELLKDDFLNKFDCVTYKTIKKNKEIDEKDIQNFINKL